MLKYIHSGKYMLNLFPRKNRIDFYPTHGIISKSFWLVNKVEIWPIYFAVSELFQHYFEIICAEWPNIAKLFTSKET